MRQLPSLLLAGALAACGGDSAGPSVFYESVAGSYAGTMSGTSQGVALAADFGITITQSEGSLSGSYSVSGTASDGQTTVPVQGTGSIAGTIADGHNPSVNFTVTPGPCPNRAVTFTGTYDSANHRLIVTGPVYLMDEGCGIVVTYQMTLTLTK